MRVPCEQLQYGRYNFCLATFAGIFWSIGSLQDHITTVNFPFGLLAYLICFSWTYWSYFVWNPSSVQYLTIDTGCGVAPLYVHVFHIVPLCLWVLGLWTISRESLHSNHSMVLTVPTENPWTSEARFSDNISANPVSRATLLHWRDGRPEWRLLPHLRDKAWRRDRHWRVWRSVFERIRSESLDAFNSHMSKTK